MKVQRNAETMKRIRSQQGHGGRVPIGAYLLVGLLLGLLLPAWAEGQERSNVKADPMKKENVQRGMSQFKQSCSMCHGSEAKGATGPNLIESSLVRHDDNGNLIGEVIREGRLPKGMPAFPDLSVRQVGDLVVFLHAVLEVSDNRSSGGPARGYSLKRLLTGDAEDGKQYFNGEGGCASCHSVTGDLKGVAKKYSPTELEGRILYPAVKNETAVVSLPSGEKIKGQLLHRDSFYVALWDGEGNYRSWPLRQGAKVDVEDPLRGHRELLERYKDKDIHDVFAYLETLQ
jgi:cytochrome c oxidase cbb3-type subunit 3